jgi:hypothetical protein
VIYRGFVGTEFPPFTVEMGDDFLDRVTTLVQGGVSRPRGSLPLNWPAFMALRGAACLMSVWEKLGVDPLGVRLIHEEFVHHREPKPLELLVGRMRVEDVSDHMEPLHGIEEQVDLLIRFHDSASELLAEYRCSYRVPVARTQGRKD